MNWLLVLLLVAQTPEYPLHYSLRRLTVYDPTAPYPMRANFPSFYEVAHTALVCDLPPGDIVVPGFRIADPVHAGKDCEWVAPEEALSSIFRLAEGGIYTWAVAQQFEEGGVWSEPVDAGTTPTALVDVRVRVP